MVAGGVVALVNLSKATPVERFKASIEPILFDYCYDCHGDGDDKGNVAFDAYETPEAIVADVDLWAHVLKNVRAGMMPPAKKSRPDVEEIQELVDWIKSDVFRIDPENVDPGRVTVRRLNRVEYGNTIRDLMGVRFNSEVEFPPDDTGFGFDNIGDVLSISPLLLEKYMQAAEQIVAEAVPLVELEMESRIASRGDFRGEGEGNGDYLDFYKPYELEHVFDIEKEGIYRVVFETTVLGSFDFDAGRALGRLSIDEEEMFEREYVWGERKAERDEYEFHWKSGTKRFAFIQEPLSDPADKKNPIGLRISRASVVGPIAKEHWVRPANYERFFPEGPAPNDLAEKRAYAHRILAGFTKLAFRRPVEDRLVERLVEIAEVTYLESGTRFEEGIARAMVAVLASPRFLFRIESTLPGNGTSHQLIDEHALASRLSYFFWSTMPDAELTALADQGRLRESLDEQVQRLFEDRRSEALIENFTGQWLQARDVESVPINAREVLGGQRRRGGRRVDFDSELRKSMRRETEMAFSHVARNDLSVLDLLDADYTFLNERLANHYGIEGVEGREMRLVKLPEGDPRGGILTQGTALTVTSNPTRTSPVKRGLFVLDNILGTPPPPPPAAVPELEEAGREITDHEPSVREMLERHRNEPICRSCHERMDPLGLALENFNALGMWRDKDGDADIESAGRLITGEQFADIRELKKVLREEQKTNFYRCLTEKFLTYAIGRGLEFYDVQTVDNIVAELEQSGGRFSALLNGVVDSAPFQKRRDGREVTSNGNRNDSGRLAANISQP